MDQYYGQNQLKEAASRGYHNGGGTAVCDPPIETGAVIRGALDAHESTLAELHETISRLEGRLDPALTPAPPQPTGATSGPSAPPCSHVALRLVSLNSGYRHAVERLRELTQRVEV